MDDPDVVVLDFPSLKVKGVVVSLEDGSSKIYINARLSREEQLRVYAHELSHIRRDDFYNDTPLEIAEDAML
jgi:Zn-dependent peptidase ImmA (M78 family)